MKSSTSAWERDWVSKVTAKQSSCRAIAQYYQSRVCNGSKAVGEEIARLQVRRFFCLLPNFLFLMHIFSPFFPTGFYRAVQSYSTEIW